MIGALVCALLWLPGRLDMNEQTAAIVRDYWVYVGNGVNELLKAYRYAVDSSVCAWQFALPDNALRQCGMSESDLRWLLQKSYAECRLEITRPGDEERVFAVDASHSHLMQGCFVLTDLGFRSLQSIATECSCNGADKQVQSPSRVLPHWDAVRHELRFSGVLIKRFRTPAPNQEKILEAFQEENWTPRIDDPLAPIADQNPKQRLHDTIRSLNRAQQSPLLRFAGDGTGEGVLWMECDANGTTS